jgi:hypothetical protein
VKRSFTVLALSPVTLAVLLASFCFAGAAGDPKASSGQKDSPAYVPQRKPPSNSVALFNGKDLSNWRQPGGRPAVWKVKDGVMSVARGNIVTDETFSDAFIHVEFMEPYVPEATGQEKGNSGVYLQGRYEIQVLDSYGIKIPGTGDCGAMYGQYAPLVNACKPPLEWQTYDAIFRAPRVDQSGKVIERARITVLQNGVVIHNNVELLGPTAGHLDENVGNPGPLLLQDHGSPIQYRNIWLVHLPLKGSDKY